MLMTSAEAFTVLKLAGCAYLVWLGLKTIREAKVELPADVTARGSKNCFREGVIVEALNPKTAAFFLAFIPQFVDPAQGGLAFQFVALGSISVVLNTAADVVVACAAAKARDGLIRRPQTIRRLRAGSGAVMCGLGVSLAFARRN